MQKTILSLFITKFVVHLLEIPGKLYKKEFQKSFRSAKKIFYFVQKKTPYGLMQVNRNLKIEQIPLMKPKEESSQDEE